MTDAVPKKWDATKITSQKGKKAIVTGGFTATNLGDALFANSNWFVRQSLKLAWNMPCVVLMPEFGALPSLYAAVGENVKPNDFFGPDGFQALTGYPTKEDPVNVSKSEEYAARLWEESEKLAKLNFAI